LAGLSLQRSSHASFAGTLGAVTGEYAGASRAAAGIAAFGTSLAQDYAAGRPLDYGSASVTSGTVFATGEFFKFGLGAALAEKAAQKGVTSLSEEAAANQVRYQIGQGVFQTAAGVEAQNYYFHNFNFQRYSPQNFPIAQSTPNTLPAAVNQNGITYVRNSSGLLNFAALDERDNRSRKFYCHRSLPDIYVCVLGNFYL
jgi:hypothetical protein